MPPKFTRCVNAGGKVRTRRVAPGKIQKVCVRPGGATGPRGGRTVGGHVQKTKRSR